MKKTITSLLFKLNTLNFRRRTVGDPAFIANERALAEMYANCFLLVPLVSICHTATPNTANNNNELMEPNANTDIDTVTLR